MPPEVTITPSVPNDIGLPSIDFSPWFTAVFKWLISIWPTFVVLLKGFIGLLIGLAFPISLLLFIGIIYTVEQLKRIRKKEEQVYDLKVEPAFEEVPAEPQGDPTLARRWEKVADHIESENPNDWKQAIMEADIMLDEVLTKLGYRGDGIGEKLKRAEPADFATIQDAWEAHKVRNQIAHEGSAFNLNHHEAKRVFQLYKKVFEEFYYL